MADERFDFMQDEDKADNSAHFYEAMPSIVKRLMESCLTDECFDHVDSTPIPSLKSIANIIQQARRIIFPGYFTQNVLAPSNLEYCLRQEAKKLYRELSKQIILCFQHDNLLYGQLCQDSTEPGHQKALQFMHTLPKLRTVLTKDVRAGFEGDPAAKSPDEIIFSYPGLLAVTVYRLAHNLHLLEVPLLPRMMTEYAHGLTGIDIHPGAKIAESFFIDHGTGVVVGETAEIGKRVRIYQGVTLGALSIPSDSVDLFRDKKRHPTIEDDVIVYSNATILGGDTIIGARSTIGGNVWIIDEIIPPDTKVVLKKPELIYSSEKNKKQISKLPKQKFTTKYSKEASTLVGHPS